MESQDIKNAISGILVVDKPVGLTSHDVVDIIRRGTNIRRAGHTGTLDPRASGVLVVLIGPAVRLSEFVSASDKRYQAILRLGSSTDTYDAEGRLHPAVHCPGKCDRGTIQRSASALYRGNRADSAGLFSRQGARAQSLRDGP